MEFRVEKSDGKYLSQRRFTFYQNDEQVGQASVKEIGPPCIDGLEVEEEFRGRGIGSEILEKLSDFYEDKYPEIFVDSMLGRCGFYEENGFQIVHREFPEVFMKKEL